MAVVATATCYPQKSVAQAFTGNDFLAWSASDQRGYVSAQFGMAVTIAARMNPPMSQCIADEFYGRDGFRQERLDAVARRVGQFPNHHPSSVFLIMIENACGRFSQN